MSRSLLCGFLVVLWSCTANLESGTGTTGVFSTIDDELVYRDFLVKLPAKDFRKKFGHEKYRFPKIKTVLLMFPSDASVAVLGSIMRAVNFHRHEIDVVLFYPDTIVSTFIAEGLEGCHKVLVADSRTWLGTEEFMLERKYDTLVFVPSEDQVADASVVRVATRPGPPLAQQSLLISAQSYVRTFFDHWTAHSAAFDYSVYWGTAGEYMQRATTSSPASCLILASRKHRARALDSHFLNKLLCLVRKMTQLRRSSWVDRGGGGEVQDLDAVALLRPSDVFLDSTEKVYVKAVFG